ncbi:MAG: QueT transporter family protein [Clostridia bacterium]|nr:QueT transporter family protein [Clostridia bacterium]
MFKFTTQKLVRAGIIAALYTAVTYALAPYAYGPFQIRPAEALCLLPLFYIEAVPGLFVGCALANLFSQFGIYDIVFGSLTTLIAATLTFVIGRVFKENLLSAIIGGIFPVLLNAVGIPLIIVLTGAGWEAYFALFGEFMLTQTVWVYGLGIPLYFAIIRLRKHTRFLQSDDYAAKLAAESDNTEEKQAEKDRVVD